MHELAQLKTNLTHEIELLNKEINEVENDTLGTFNRIKSFTSQHITRIAGLGSVMGEVYRHSQHNRFNNAREYIDYLKSSASKAKDVISKVDHVYSNLEKCRSDIQHLIVPTNIWIQKADELIK